MKKTIITTLAAVISLSCLSVGAANAEMMMHKHHMTMHEKMMMKKKMMMKDKMMHKKMMMHHNM